MRPSPCAGVGSPFVNGRQLGAGIEGGAVLSEGDVITFSKKIVGGC